jgi:adenine-specific DNA-methyltransferase
VSAGKSHDSRDERPTRRADRVGAEVVARKTTAQRKAAGLYLTPVEVADFMAAQVIGGAGSVRILDPAAGSGTLLCAVVERLASASPPVREADLTAYETDPDMQNALRAALEDLTRWAAKYGTEVKVKVEKADFVAAHAHVLKANGQLFGSQLTKPFDVVIANPPYFKIPKSDARARAAATVVYGQPNIYALFMAAAAALLHEGGEFLFITPRSFASGPYFRQFRERFFNDLRPTSVHLFGSRRDAFSRDEVLQENIILRGVREDGWQSRRSQFELHISSSAGIADLDHCATRSLPLDEALSKPGTDRIFRLPILRSEDDAVKLVDSWTDSLHGLGMNISTGPVVPFRSIEFLANTGVPANSYVPLIWMNHVHAMRVSFSNGIRKPQYIKRSASEKSLLLPNRNYVLLRRFSAKEEARRLVAAPWIRHASPCQLLGIENHLNYIYRSGDELTEDEAFGLAALLNSRLLDTYFRVSSGNTQVSATELRAMPLPPIDRIVRIGRRVKLPDGELEKLDEIVEEAVGASR